MKHLKLIFSIILTAILLPGCSCNNSTNRARAHINAQVITKDSAFATNNSTNKNSNTEANNADTSSTAQQANNTDSMIAKTMSVMLGNKDSGILKSPGGGKNMDSMMQKMQSMMGGKNGTPGNAIAKSLLNFQLGQMSNNNPLKQVTQGKMAAQENGTAGPDKAYSAAYTPEHEANYTVPVSGNGNTIMLQYTGGTVANNKKDGLWKNEYISTNKANKWNVYSESYAESSAINMKVHATSLESVNENYSINLNDQYKKYNKQQRSDAGKNELDVQVQKMGREKMFGYHCIHVRVTFTIKALGQTASEQNDEWYSAEVPGAEFLSPIIFENHSPEVVKKMMEAGCSGALVKSVTTSTGSSELIQLSSITKKDTVGSTFNLPSNYQEDKNTALYDIQ